MTPIAAPAMGQDVGGVLFPHLADDSGRMSCELWDPAGARLVVPEVPLIVKRVQAGG